MFASFGSPLSAVAAAFAVAFAPLLVSCGPTTLEPEWPPLSKKWFDRAQASYHQVDFEDAEIAVQHGVEVVYVSNHGGRQLDHGLGSAAVLPGVVAAVKGKAEVWVDGGFMRGSDVVKAIALGAKAVGIGRLTGLGLAAGGAPGLVRALEILEDEVRICLGLLGVASFSELTSKHVTMAPAVNLPDTFSAFPLM
jgi:glycolate oxidase